MSFGITINLCGLSPKYLGSEPPPKQKNSYRVEDVFIFMQKKNLKAGPRSRWQNYAKNATFQIAKWTRVQRSNFLYFIN